MHTQLATIAEIPLVVILFLLKHWQTILAGTWGAGFALIAFRAMVRWYREDAADASYNVPQGDEGAIYDAMREIKGPKRPARMKWLFTRGLFWMPILAWQTVVKIAKFAFYPILVVIDREKSKAVRHAAKAPKPFRREAGALPMATVEPAVKVKAEVECSLCHDVVPTEASHNCRSVELHCRRCSGRIMNDLVHRCGGLAEREESFGENGDSDEESNPVECDQCGEEMVPNQVHHCEDKVELVFCRTCNEKYDPEEDRHELQKCGDCDTRHCTGAGCP